MSQEKKKTEKTRLGYIPSELQKLILAIVKEYPEYSSKKISQALPRGDKGKPIVGNHGVQNVLEKFELSTYKKRLAYSQGKFPIWEKRIEAKKPKLTALDRLEAVEKVVKEGKSIASVCQAYQISRTLFYRLLRRYEETYEDQRLAALTDYSRAPKRIAKKLSPKIEKQVLELVKIHPELSTLKIAQILWPAISKKGVFNVFKRHNLSIYEKRLAWAQAQKPVFIPKLPTIPLIPSLKDLRWLIAPFTTIPKLIWLATRGRATLSFFLFGLFLFFIWVKFIFLAPGVSRIGILFATNALFFGFFFFLYSLKYYFSAILVLTTPQGQGGREQETSDKQGKEKDFGLPAEASREGWSIARILKIPVTSFERFLAAITPQQQPPGLVADLSEVKLDKLPFVSIHIPLFNEKKVAERILTAAISQEYPKDKFEIIVCDDSTDETTEIVKKFETDRILESSRTGLEHPRVRVIHRDNRQGFKGGALEEARKVTDPAAEYILIFDADFIPFPDTITSFIKYFQLSDNNKVAAVQGYQWHVLNKSENWITRGVRTEYAGSYVVERSATEIYSGLKMIAGSVYCIRRDILDKFGWGTSITEDFQLTLRLYQAGYKVIYTPYVQTPSECVSTIRRLVRQRMRWAEGHTFNIKRQAASLLASRSLTLKEKLEFSYLAPYYLQAAFFMIGTLSWFASETIFATRLPFWTATLGWSLVFTNFLALPLINSLGLFLEEAEKKDYFGIPSFIALSYIVTPFQAYAAVKGLLENQEGPWFRTPKTGLITDVIGKVKLGFWWRKLLPWIKPEPAIATISNFKFKIPHSTHSFIQPKQIRWIGNMVFGVVIAITVIMSLFAPLIPVSNSYASQPVLRTVGQLQNEQPKSLGDPQNPSNKEEIFKNAQTEEITTPRAVQKTTKGGKKLEFIFHQEPRVRIKLDGHQEIEFETVKIGGKSVNPQKALIYADKEVRYFDIIPGVDLKYSITGDLIAEEFIVKNREATQLFGNKVEQIVKTVDVKIVSPHPSSFGFYSNDGKELFMLSRPFAKDAKGEVSNDLSFALEKATIGSKLTKTLGNSAKTWLADPARVYPVSIDPSVIVSGGIVATEVQFGGLQRKVAFVNGNWYAFYNDGGVVSYKKSSDGSSWGGAVTVSDGDTDNYNPSISVSGNIIIVFWIDDIPGTTGDFEGRTIDTSLADAQGTMCSQLSGGTVGSTFMITVAAVSTTQAVVAYSDTSTDTEVDVFAASELDATCSITDIEPGNIDFGSGITAGDRPVIVPLSSKKVAMIFQDGDLSYSEFDIDAAEWTTNNLTVASVTDNIYSVTTDQAASPKVWILTANISDATDTNFYTCCSADIAETTVDSDTGGNAQDMFDLDMFCPTSDNCKIVYTDDTDTTAPAVKFVDCNDETCSAPTITTIDSDIGASGDDGGVSIYCVASDNCKVVYGDDMDTTAPLLQFVDCTADEDCSTNTITNVDADLGDSTAVLHSSIYCPADDNCKFLYNDSGLADFFFVDCPDATCTSTGRVITQIDGAAAAEPRSDLYCVASNNCKFVYTDQGANTDDVVFVDCTTDEDCSTRTATIIDSDIGNSNGAFPVSIDCVGGDTDCKFIYADGIDSDLFVVNCSNDTCGAQDTGSPNSFDARGGTTGTAGLSRAGAAMDCVTAVDCKFVYMGDTFAGTTYSLYFIDCDDSGNSNCTSGSAFRLPGPRFSGAIQCLTSVNCKMVYLEGTASTNPALVFADCDVTNCFPSATDDTDPWQATGSNIETVSLTYDSTNSDLYAHIIQDASDQAYFESSDATTISWGAQTSYAFTAGTLDEISAPERGAGTSQIGVVLHQNGNFEFAVVPEKTLFLLTILPFLPGILRKLRKRRRLDGP